MRNVTFALALVPFVTCASPWASLASATSSGISVQEVEAPRRLRVESLVEPLGIDVAEPRFSWEFVDARRGALQTAWQVLVATDPALLAQEKGDAWDSGKVEGRDTNQVEYSGKPLVPGRAYHWTVRTWDRGGKPSAWSPPARFGTGPREASDWVAQWIGEPRAEAAAKPNTAASDVAPAPGSARKGYHSAWAKKADDYGYIQLDFGELTIFDEIRIHPARPDGDATKPGVLFPLQYRLYVDDTEAFDRKYMRIHDHTWGDVPNAGSAPEIAKVGRYKVRYLRFIPAKMQAVPGKGFAYALGEIEVFDGATNITKKAKIKVSDSLEEDGWTSAALNDGELLGNAPSTATPAAPVPPPAPAANTAVNLREDFTVPSPIQRATLYASALGLYEATINGVRVGDERLAPGWTDYRVRVPFQAFDVTSLVREGPNAIGCVLADGWYSGRVGLTHIVPNGKSRGLYGAKPRFLAQLEIERADGTKQIVATSSSWRVTSSGPIRAADLLDGETVDARNDLGDWDRPGFDETGWLAVEVGADTRPKPFFQVQEPIRAVATIAAKSVVEQKPGVFLYDFGENMSGVVRVRVTGKAGQELVVRHGEVRDTDGSLYVANLRGARATDRFVLRGLPEGETFEPRFTCHGFRYAEISGLSASLPLDAVTAVVLSTDARTTGAFECSDAVMNAIWRNSERSLRANWVGLPTDCPQRDERLGWMGDILVYVNTGLFQRDLAASLAQWMGEVRLAQAKDGRFPDFAPHPFDPDARFSGAPGWADAAIFVPFSAYVHHHDRRMIAEIVKPAWKWLEHVRSKNPGLVWKEARGNDYGDWLNGNLFQFEGWVAQGHEMPKDVFATAYFARSAELNARLAFIAGEHEIARKSRELADAIKAAFRNAFVAADGTIQGDTQAGYALALDFDLLPEGNPRLDAAERLVDKIKSAGGALGTGFMSTRSAYHVLSRHGHHGLAVELARKTTFPSLGYTIQQGATSIWERMDGFVPGRGFQDVGMNSFNHYAFGCVGEWMVREVAGIQPDEDRYVSSGSITLMPQPNGKTRTSAEGPRAFEHVTLRPRIEGGLTHARAHYDSVVGRIESGWKLDGKTLQYACTVPANSSATLELPAKEPAKVTEGASLASEARGVIYVGERNGRAVFDLGAGSFEFRSQVP